MTFPLPTRTHFYQSTHFYSESSPSSYLLKQMPAVHILYTFCSGGRDLLNHFFILFCMPCFLLKRQKTTTDFFPVGRVRENKGDCWHTDNSDGFYWSDDMMLVVATLEDQNQRGGCGFGVQIPSPPSVFFFFFSLMAPEVQICNQQAHEGAHCESSGVVAQTHHTNCPFLCTAFARDTTHRVQEKDTSTHHKVFF